MVYYILYTIFFYKKQKYNNKNYLERRDTMTYNTFERYCAVHAEILNRLENKKITVEQAKNVIDLAFNKYIVESTDDTQTDDGIETLKARKTELDNEYRKCESELAKINDVNGSSEDAKKYTDIEKRMKEISSEQKEISKKLNAGNVFTPSNM